MTSKLYLWKENPCGVLGARQFAAGELLESRGCDHRIINVVEHEHLDSYRKSRRFLTRLAYSDVTPSFVCCFLTILVRRKLQRMPKTTI